MKRLTLATALLGALLGAAGISHARGPDSLERLATLPNTTAAQQEQILAIEEARRTAYHALFEKMHDERARIDREQAAKLRKLLGEDGYRKYAQWKLDQRGGPKRDGAHRRHRGMDGQRADRGPMPEPADLPPPAEG